MPNQYITSKVYSIRYEAQDINSIELRPNGESLFPSFEPGAHISLHLPNGISRSYSLISAPQDRERYVIAVLLDRNSRGGSSWIHRNLRVGDEIKLSIPRNNFPVDLSAPKSVLLAGGIGVTPILSIYRELLAREKEAELIYCARSRVEAALLDTLMSLGGRTHCHFDEEAGNRPDIETLLKGYDKDTHFYCCGPTPMLDSFEAVCRKLGYGSVHTERFTSAAIVSEDSAGDYYEVELARSGITLNIAPGEKLLDRLLDAGVDVDYSCQEGICGACEVSVIDGEVDHRDSILSEDERIANTKMLVCVSACKNTKLTLDI